MYLAGTTLFLIPRVINSFNFWGLSSKKSPKFSGISMFYFIMGELFLFFVFLDIGNTLSLGPSLILSQYYEIIPDVLMIIISINFMMQSFIQISKNSVIIVSVSGSIEIIMLIVMYLIYPFVKTILPSSEYYFAIICIIIAIISAAILYKYLIKNKPENSKVIYTLNKVWSIFNNSILLCSLFLISIIELLLQFQGYTVITLFSFLGNL